MARHNNSACAALSGDTRPAHGAKYLTLQQAAEHVATPAETVRYWVHTGKLNAFKPGRQVLIRESDLDALIEASAYGAVREAKAKRARKARVA